MYNLISEAKSLHYRIDLCVQKPLNRYTHDVAIIGFRKSGKTTLITSLFGELFAKKVLGAGATPRGINTIERINSDLEKLERGEALGPTTDQDLFAYRSNLKVGSSFLSNTYKITIGDFPGEYSERFTTEAEKGEEWLHKSSFFKWVTDADAFVFVIDLAQYLKDKPSSNAYIPKINKVIRASWQNLLDHHQDTISDIANKPLVLVFTKADLFGVTTSPTNTKSITAKIMALGFGNKLPEIHEINKTKLKTGEKNATDDFEDLIVYLKSESNNFKMWFVSSFGVVNGKRLNFDSLFRSILPPASVARGTQKILGDFFVRVTKKWQDLVINYRISRKK